MPAPKQMLWTAAIAGGVYFLLRHYEARAQQGGGKAKGTRYGA